MEYKIERESGEVKGIEISRVIGEIPDNIICFVCKRIAWKPLICAQCMKSIGCKQCLMDITTHSFIHHCPHSNIHPQDTNQTNIPQFKELPPFLLNTWKLLELRCSNYPKCEVESTYENIHLHTICPHDPLKCRSSSCQIILPRKELPSHESTCSNFRIKCKYSGCEVFAERKHMSNHYGKCEFRVIKCVHCGREVITREIGEHEEFCSKRVFKCRNVGCQFEGVKTLLSKHEEECALCLSTCSNTECGREMFKTQLANHMGECIWSKCKCTTCGKPMLRKDLPEHKCEISTTTQNSPLKLSVTMTPARSQSLQYEDLGKLGGSGVPLHLLEIIKKQSEAINMLRIDLDKTKSELRSIASNNCYNCTRNISKCKGCQLRFCVNCSSKCGYCQEIFCESCSIFPNKCSICDLLICNKCSKSIKCPRCEECKCMQHISMSEICAICQGSITCKCKTECDACNALLCLNCKQNLCPGCANQVCDKCQSKCTACGTLICIHCTSRSCPTCLSLCQACYNSNQKQVQNIYIYIYILEPYVST